MFKQLVQVLFFTVFANSISANECGIKLGGAGKNSPWLKLKHNQITTISDIGGPWDFVRQTYGACEFELYNKGNYQGRRARYGEGISHRLRIGAKGGIDKNGWKARSLKIVPRKKNCRIELQENEVPGLSGQTTYRRQTFYGPSKIRNLTGWSTAGEIAEHCKYIIYNGANLDGKSIELKRLNHPKKNKWRIRSMEIVEVNAPIPTKRGKPTFKEIKHLKGRCLDISGGINKNETNVQIYQCNGSKSQKWRWTKNKQIRNIMGRCLDVSGVNITNNSNVEIYKCNNSITQKWKKISNSRIQNLSGFCLDIVNGVNVNKTNVQLYRCKNVDAQQWQSTDVRAHRKPNTSNGRSTDIRDHRNSNKDADKDGIKDDFENILASKFAPVVRLPPSSKDWTRPANVDWYLQRVQLRFENKGACNKDDQILKVGQVTQSNLARQSHRDKDATWKGCKNKGTKRHSNSSKRFFLQPADKYHKGAHSSEWKTYVHVKNSQKIRTGYDIQYWFFYAYNDSFASFNHEGDWEHITVSTDNKGNFIEAIYAQHEYSTSYNKSKLTFVNQTHPVVYVADGSHASYARAGSIRIRDTPVYDHTYDGGPVWNTKQNLINVGEKNYPLNGQFFIQYGGLWGEIGETKHTSGPTGPAFKASWNNR